MARLVVCAVYDAAVRAYIQPLFFRSKQEALRAFGDAVAEEKSQFRVHAADYTFQFLGNFDDQTGAFEQPSQPERLISAQECLPPA